MPKPFAPHESKTLLLEIRALRKRAERAEAQAGLVACRDCVHWRRGHDTYPKYRVSEGASWGACTMTDPVIWDIEIPWRGEPGARIITKENFGCVRGERPGDRLGGDHG